MKITVDHAFHIGSQHLRSGLPCQDFAVSAETNNITCAVVSDGCSSGRMTDVGARIISLNTINALVNYAEDGDQAVDEYCEERDAWMMAGLGLIAEDLLATSGYILARRGSDEIYVRLIGDGVIASRKANGDLLMERIDWAGNMPAYRIYAMDQHQGFISAHGGDAGAYAVTSQFHVRSAAGREDETVTRAIADGIKGVVHLINSAASPFVAVFSDGVTQVDGMDWRDVVAELMAFKSTEGDFVKRRMNRFLKDCLKHGKGPVDDISMACIHLDHEAA